METDAFFCNLFKQLPQTVFELLHLPAELARWYRFDAVELKKALRIDGLLQPTKSDLPLYFVEVQYRNSAKFYANLFAKVFGFLDENDPAQDWVAVAIFSTRRVEPKTLTPYEVLLASRHVQRIYLDEFPIPADPPLGLGLLQLASAPVAAMKDLVNDLREKADRQFADSEHRQTVIELAEEILLRRFTQHNREEIRKMFELHDLRESKVWQEAHQTGIEKGIEKGREEGIEKGIEKGREEGIEKGREEGIEKGIEKGKAAAQGEFVRKCLARGMSAKEVAQLLEIPLSTVRRLAKNAAK